MCTRSNLREPWPADHRDSMPAGTTLVTDGGERADDESTAGESTDETSANKESTDNETVDDEENAENSGMSRSNVEITDAGDAEPAEPKWEEPDLDEVPPVSEPKVREPPEGSGAERSETEGKSREQTGETGGQDRTSAEDPTAGMPNTARSPEATRIDELETEAYIVALELCARLPEDAQLPEEAADLVPAALEAELENDVQSFAATEFDNPQPYVDTLQFVEADDDIWLKLRVGAPPEAFDDLETELESIQAYALQQLDSLF